MRIAPRLLVGEMSSVCLGSGIPIILISLAILSGSWFICITYNMYIREQKKRSLTSLPYPLLQRKLLPHPFLVDKDGFKMYFKLGGETQVCGNTVLFGVQN